jgi:hypothetical protein
MELARSLRETARASQYREGPKLPAVKHRTHHEAHSSFPLKR